MESVKMGATIQKRRKDLGLTQKKLGELCGYEGRNAELMVQHWEHDRLQPSLEKLRPLSEALHITLDELIP